MIENKEITGCDVSTGNTNGEPFCVPKEQAIWNKNGKATTTNYVFKSDKPNTKGVESKLDNIEKSIGNLKTMSEFVEDYKDFVNFILKIRKEAQIGNMQVKSMSINNNWTLKYPYLLEDIYKITGELKLFGIEIVARLEEI